MYRKTSCKCVIGCLSTYGTAVEESRIDVSTLMRTTRIRNPLERAKLRNQTTHLVNRFALTTNINDRRSTSTLKIFRTRGKLYAVLHPATQPTHFNGLSQVPDQANKAQLDSGYVEQSAGFQHISHNHLEVKKET